MKANIYYNGFIINQDGCKFTIKGYKMTFYTLESAKHHIDLMKNYKPLNPKSFHQ